jgi:hypothetical protein
MAKEDLNTLRKRSHEGIVSDAAGNEFLIQDDDTILLLGGPNIETQKGSVITAKDKRYGAYINALLKDTAEDDLSYDASDTFLRSFDEYDEDLLGEKRFMAEEDPFVNRGGQKIIDPKTGKPKLDEDGNFLYYTKLTPTDSSDPGAEGRYFQTPEEKQASTDRLLAGGEDPVKQKAARDAARLAELQRAQLKGFAIPLGAAAITGGIDLAIAFMDTSMDKRVAERKAEELGKPIIPAEQMAIAQESAKMISAGARAVGRESRMRQEGVQAAQGVQTSAASDVRQRREEALVSAEGAAAAGREKGRLLAGFYTAGEKRKKDVLDAVADYEAKRQMQRAGAVSKFGSEFGKVAGPIFAQAPAKDPGIIDPLYAGAAKQGVLLQPEEATKLSRQLRYAPGLDEERIAEILKEYDLEPTDELVSSLTRRV